MDIQLRTSFDFQNMNNHSVKKMFYFETTRRRDHVYTDPPPSFPYKMVPKKEPFLLPFCGDVGGWVVPFCKEIPTEILLRKIGVIPFVSVDGFFGPNCIP